MPEPFKNMYNRQSVAVLGRAIQSAYPAFDVTTFLERVFDAGWDDRELMARKRHITLSLAEGLPADYREALALMRRALPLLEDQGFEKMVFPDFVEVYGLDDVEASIPALEQFTQAISAEFAVRPFIERYPERFMQQMLAWLSTRARTSAGWPARAAARACRGASASRRSSPIPRPSCRSSRSSRTIRPRRCGAAWPTT